MSGSRTGNRSKQLLDNLMRSARAGIKTLSWVLIISPGFFKYLWYKSLSFTACGEEHILSVRVSYLGILILYKCNSCLKILWKKSWKRLGHLIWILKKQMEKREKVNWKKIRLFASIEIFIVLSKCITGRSNFLFLLSFFFSFFPLVDQFFLLFISRKDLMVASKAPHLKS